MERQFFRERMREELEVKPRAEQLNIGVTGLGRSMGTTFVATALAFYFKHMGKKVTFVQCMTPGKAAGFLFDGVAMDQRFAHRKFQDPYVRIGEEASLRTISNMEEGINWLIPSKASPDLEDQQKARLIQGAKGEVCIFDVEAEENWDIHLLDMDMLVVVADPLPSKLIRNTERYKRLKKMELSGMPTVWVVNRNNTGVNQRQTKGFLKNNHLVWIPSFSPELIYQCEYACKYPWENKEIQRNLLEIFTKVSRFKESL